MIPVAKVSGGGGGGGKRADESGGGFGLSARPAGVFVVRDGDARWRPAIDVNRVIFGGQLVAVIAILTLGPVLRRWLSQPQTTHKDDLQVASPRPTGLIVGTPSASVS